MIGRTLARYHITDAIGAGGMGSGQANGDPHNPMDGASVAYMGTLLAYAGDWKSGIELIDRLRKAGLRYVARSQFHLVSRPRNS